MFLKSSLEFKKDINDILKIPTALEFCVKFHALLISFSNYGWIFGKSGPWKIYLFRGFHTVLCKLLFILLFTQNTLKLKLQIYLEDLLLLAAAL